MEIQQKVDFGAPDVRHDWTIEQALEWFGLELGALLDRARWVHSQYAHPDIQQCQLLSIKTGGCAEDCGYCSQSARFQTGINAEPLLDPETIFKTAEQAKSQGATRFCMGAAWRSVPTDSRFEKVLESIRKVDGLGLEVCCTLGMASEQQLTAMKEAGLSAYNHNLDTSREYYPQVITTRTFEDRMNTLRAARRAGVQICSGGILGLGETVRDRASMLVELANLNPHPESVPINLLVPVEGTPLAQSSPVPFEDFLRTIAVARILMPRSRVRLSAGRNSLTQEQQRKCFEAGANSIFVGEKLLTTPNVSPEADKVLLQQVR